MSATDNFTKILKGLNERAKQDAVDVILAKFREGNATNPKFYNDPNAVKAVSSWVFDHVDTSDVYLETLAKVESAGPYSIFSYIMSENFSDIIIHKTGFQLADATTVQNIDIPEDTQTLYRKFVDHFIENIMFLSSQKFDPVHSILDAEIGIFRFNIIHKSLNTNGYHTLVIRKQTLSRALNMDPDVYLSSIGVSERQVEMINKYAFEGNVVVFGAVGSGKTTLVKYMGNYRLADKRNLITIEDTPELGIKVPIALVTNQNKRIKDLFTASLRQNPSHVIIGETRTDEIVDILESALTISVLTTIHANSLRRAIERIVFMSMERNLQPEDMRNLINSTIDLFIFMDHRKVKGMWEHVDGEDNVYDAYKRIE